MSDILKKVISVVEEAGKIIMKIHNSHDIGLGYKKDLSPLTRADMASNNFIREALSNAFNYPVISEETDTPYESRKEWETFWLVDPLDGTKEFVARNPEFTINIALIKSGKPELGVIYAPALDDLFYAERGAGAYWKKKGETTTLPCFDFQEPIMCTSRFHETKETRQFARLNSIHQRKTIGAALKFGCLATGSATVYPRYAGSMEWDIAAGHAILKESGGKIVDLATMKEPVYNKPSLKNNFFIASSNRLDPLQFQLLPNVRKSPQ